jgi:serine/threonine protein kinase
MEQLGRYEIIEEIGQGGFAVVYRARDTQLDREVALKELRPALLSDTAWVERFRREARAIARLDHPHIVPIYDIYEPPNRLFLVMRYVTGPGLHQLLGQRGQLGWQETLDIMITIAEGLDYAHSLEKTMRRAELKIENTLSMLGTVYPQILTSQSANQVSDYSRISSAVSEEVRVLRDHLDALEEVKFGQIQR